MEISKTWIVLIVIALIILGALWYFKPSTEREEMPKGPADYNEEEFIGLPSEEEGLDEIEQYALENYPRGKITGVELQPNKILFGGKKLPHTVFYFEIVLLRNLQEFLIDETEFIIGLEKAEVREGDYFYVLVENLTDDFEEFLKKPMLTVAKKRIEFNKVSDEPIAFPIFDPYTREPLIQVEYYYYIRETEGVPEIYFLLAKQDFSLQFEKKLRFAGTDELMSGNPNLPYYWPDLEFFGSNPLDAKHLIAHIKLDEDADGEFEITAFVDTGTGELLDLEKYGLRNYNYAVEFEGTGISNEEQKSNTSFGTILQIEWKRFSAGMPVP